jgi:hypothetical protein
MHERSSVADAVAVDDDDGDDDDGDSGGGGDEGQDDDNAIMEAANCLHAQDRDAGCLVWLRRSDARKMRKGRE